MNLIQFFWTKTYTITTRERAQRPIAIIRAATTLDLSFPQRSRPVLDLALSVLTWGVLERK